MADLLDDCFKGVHLENVNHCPNDDTGAGLSTHLLYIPAAHMETFTMPPKTNASTYEERITIPTTGLTAATGKGWKKIDLLVDENELTNALVGNKGNKKLKVDLDVFIPGTRKKTVGFQDAHKNTPMIYAIKDSTGQTWIIGNKINPAFFETSENKTGKTFENNSGITGKISANASMLAYDGDLVVLSDTPVIP